MKASLRLPSLQTMSRPLKVQILCFGIIGAAIILYFFDPAAASNFYPKSPFRVLTGLYCPGCGTLRAVHQLLHGHFLAAADLNPLMILFLPYLLYAFVEYTAPVLFEQKVPRLFIKAEWIWLGLKIILAYWVLRNLPFAPFSWLAP